MPYTPYVTSEYYFFTYKGTKLDSSEAARRLKSASRHIDSLTFNRIVKIGFDNLTPFQQDVIREVCCLQAEFEAENSDELDSMLSSYSINGVSMAFDGGWKIYIENGVAMPKATHNLLSQTGLCCRIA